MSVIGTTDDDYYGDLDDVRPTSEEVRYLVQGVARIFPAVREARIVGTWAGVRPTLYAFGPNEDKLSREHAIVDHAADGAPGVYSMLGGKLASYRLFAEEMTDRLARDFAPSSVCTTHTTPLPGGDRAASDAALTRTGGITPVAARRLIYRHGSRAGAGPRAHRAAPRRAGGGLRVRAGARGRGAPRHRPRWRGPSTTSPDGRGSGSALAAGCAAPRAAGRSSRTSSTFPRARGGAGRARFLFRQARSASVAMGPAQARQEALLLAEMRRDHGAQGEP